MTHTILEGGTKVRVLIEYTPEEVAAFPHAACAEGVEVVLDLTQLGGHTRKALANKTGRSVDAGGALVVRRRSVEG